MKTSNIELFLIEWRLQLKQQTADTLEKFREYLEDRGVNVKVRGSRGKDIDAACGQLANKQ